MLTLLALLALPAPLAARQQDLAALTAEVAKAHRTAAAQPLIEGFVANLRIEDRARTAAQRVEVELQVTFLELRDAARGGKVPLIRYKQIDSARTVEYGRDLTSYWANLDGKAQYLTTKEFESDKQSVRRNLKLARQMVRFLDPAEVLRSLQEPGAVAVERLVQGRGLDATCRAVTGRLPGFPLRQNAGDDAPVQARLFVDETDRLLALEATPLDAAGEPEVGKGEFLLFQDYEEIQGRLVPRTVLHFAIDPRGQRQLQIAVKITTLDLQPVLAATDFGKPE